MFGSEAAKIQKQAHMCALKTPVRKFSLTPTWEEILVAVEME
jgi:hypothetical protein